MTSLEQINLDWCLQTGHFGWFIRGWEILKQREDLIYHERVTKFDERQEFCKMETQEGGD